MIILETIAGSHLYGTNRPTSDQDYRGVCIEPMNALLGLATFEQSEEKEPDRVIYGLKKFVRLALANNPNVLDILFAPPDKWITVHPYWQEIYAIRHRFLSARVIDTYLGYAMSQVQKLQKTRLDTVKEFGYDVKHGAHLMRLILQLEHILWYGTHNPVLDEIDRQVVMNVLEGYATLEGLQDAFTTADKGLRQIKHALPDKPAESDIEAVMMNIYVREVFRHV